MLGLDVHTLKHGDNETFELIKRRCTNCGLRETCAADLKRDLNNPLVGTYCPNAGALNALTEAKWLAPIIENYWRQHSLELIAAFSRHHRKAPSLRRKSAFA